MLRMILEIAAGVVIGGLVLALALIISFVTRWIDPHQIAIREHNRKARQEYKCAGLKPFRSDMKTETPTPNPDDIELTEVFRGEPARWLEPMRPGRSVEAE
jgi:hypothetical protein